MVTASRASLALERHGNFREFWRILYIRPPNQDLPYVL